MVAKQSASSHVAALLNGGAVRPRDRIVTTARDMFHRHGIRGVGVDAIAEAAGTNKMTLYRHFGSKDDLILECLRTAAEEGTARWQQLEIDHPGDPRAQLRAWVQVAADWLRSDARGCDLANAAVELTEPEHPARRLIERCKGDHRDRLVRVCTAIDRNKGEMLADTLWLLLEGARVSRQSLGTNGPSVRWAAMSHAVIEAFVPS